MNACTNCQTCKHFKAFRGDAIRKLGGQRGICDLDDAIVRSRNSGCRSHQLKTRPRRIKLRRMAAA